MVNCEGCNKPIVSLDVAARCAGCLLPYHRGCVALPRTGQVSKSWNGPCCKKTTQKGDSTPVRPACTTESVTATSPIAGQNVASPAGSGAPSVLDLMYAEMREWIKEMREFRKDVHDFRSMSVENNKRLVALEQRLEAIEAHGAVVDSVAGSSAAVEELERTVETLRLELNDRDQEALLSDLDIGQLPEERGENPVHTVMTLAGRLGVTLEERDVVFAERVGSPPAATEAMPPGAGRPRRLVVRLARRHLRDELLRAARVRRTLAAPDQTQTQRRIYINERLTRHNRQLFHRVREECRAKQWRFAWTKRGRVYVRQNESSPAYIIRSNQDLERILRNEKGFTLSKNF